MAKQIINYGASANDGTGDPLRTAFIKTDNNFDQIWNAGPVGSNITILNNTVGVTNTNGNLILSPNGTGVIQTNAPLFPRLNNTYGLGYANLRYRSLYIGSGGIDLAGDLSLANIANLHIPGGSNSYVIQTDGLGNLSWAAQAGTTGNIGFIGNTIYDLNGIYLENSDLSHGATAAVILPVNGTNEPIQFNNTYGNILVQTGAGSNITAVWAFDNYGRLNLPTGGSIGTYGMGWTGITNGASGAPLSIAYLASNISYLGQSVASIDMFGSDQSGYVQIITGNAVGSSNQWLFAENGNLTVPGNIVMPTNSTLTGDGASPAPSINGFDSISAVNLSATGNITSTTSTTAPVALGSLTAVAGTRAFINDGNLAAAGNFGVQIGGTGANIVPVWSDGVNWYIG